MSVHTVRAPKRDVELSKKLIPSNERNEYFDIARCRSPKHMKLFLRKRSKRALHKTISCTERSILHHAAAAGNTEMLQYVLQYRKVRKLINRVDSSVRSPLYEAITHGHIEAANLLEQHGAKLRDRQWSLLNRARRWNNKRDQEVIEDYFITKNKDTECAICFEEFDEERRKNITDDQCLQVICCFCKAQCDKCPFCRKEL